MFFRRALLLVALACVTLGESSEVLKSSVIDKEILQRFVNLVKANQLNVSIVASKAKLWTNGLPLEMWDVALQLPLNSVHLTASQLTPQVGKQWIADVQPMTKIGKGIGTYKVVTLQNGKFVQKILESTNEEAIPISPSYEAIVGFKNGHAGFSLETPNYELIHNYVIPGADGHNETVKVLAGNINVTIIAKSDSMPAVEVDAIIKLLPKLTWMYKDSTLLAQGLVEILHKEFPQSNWQVVVGALEYHLDAVKYVTVGVGDDTVTVFAIQL